MSDTRDPRSVIDAAEQAAAAGDHASAERLLREAATLQEAALGPLHPDLANTFNNLAVVSEIVGKPDEAERCFRRAYAIATAALDADHPFVATSRKNLEDFCAASGKAIDAPKVPPLLADILPGPPLTPAPAVDPPRPADSRRQAEPRRPVDPPRAVEPARLATSPRSLDHDTPRAVTAPSVENVATSESTRGLVVAALVAGVLLVTFLAGARWFRGNEPADAEPSTVPVVVPADPPAARREPKSVAPPPAVQPAPGNEAGNPAPTKNSPDGSRAAAKPKGASTAAADARPSVADAQLCRDRQSGGSGSGEWRCDAAGSPATPGRLVFYTRLKSPRDTRVQHRWYQGDRLRQSVELTIRANPGSGYRTFSRNTVSAGEWRVELRSQDGTLLHEERFTVR
jgi:Protein of unknown function (DUF2914)/Tetratricopeptide repeat